MSDNVQNIMSTLQRNFSAAMRTMPVVIANEMVNFTKERFTAQNWLDKEAQPWQQRKNNKDQGRGILIKTARLKRAPRPVTKQDMAGVAIDVPYAEPHNSGVDKVVIVKSFTRNKYKKNRVASDNKRMKTVTGISGSSEVKEHSRHMRLPRRQFVGASQNMMERLKRAAIKHINKNMGNHE